MTRLSFAVLGVFLLLGLVACKSSTATQISQSFRNPGFEDTVFKQLFVIGVAEDQQGRIAFEDAFASAIVKKGAAPTRAGRACPRARCYRKSGSSVRWKPSIATAS